MLRAFTWVMDMFTYMLHVHIHIKLSSVNTGVLSFLISGIDTLCSFALEI